MKKVIHFNYTKMQVFREEMQADGELIDEGVGGMLRPKFKNAY